jgi:hypothetical protein
MASAAFDLGFQENRQRQDEKRAQKQAYANQEHAQKINDLIQQRQALVDKIPTLQQGTPEYDQAHTALQGVVGDIAEAYHPEKHPGAIQNLGHLITDHMGITKPQDREQKQAVEVGNKKIAAGQAADRLIAAAPPSAEQLDVQKKQAALTAIDKSDLSDEDKSEAKRKVFGISAKPLLKLYTLPGGTKIWLDASRPDLIPQGATADATGSPTTAKETIADYEKAVKDGTTALSYPAWVAEQRRKGAPSTSLGNEALDAYAKSHGFKSVNDIPPEYQEKVHEYEENRRKYITQFGAATEHTSLQTNADGQRVAVTVQDFKTPTGMVRLVDPMPFAKLPTKGSEGASGSTDRDGAPTPSGTKKGALSTAPNKPSSLPSGSSSNDSGLSRVKISEPLMVAPNKEFNDAKTAYHGAVSRMHTMDKSAIEAAHGDQQAMLSLVANHIGMTLGAQKGARINQAVWNEAVESAPGIDKLLAHFGHFDTNGDWVLDTPFKGYKGGVTLTGDQIKSMVKLAHEQVDTSRDALNDITKDLNNGVKNPAKGVVSSSGAQSGSGGDKPPKATKPAPNGATHYKKHGDKWYYTDDSGKNLGEVI